VSKELTKKAVEMLLNGATLISDPCPYCKGVRIMKDGSAFCVNCGRKVNEEKTPAIIEEKQSSDPLLGGLEQKLKELTKELGHEKDHQKQQEILKSINDIITIRDKIKKI
jgi:UPF0148 protein